MAFVKKAFRWLKRGVVPPETMQESGFKVNDGLPADYLNEALTANYEAIEELQEKVVEKVEGKGLSTNDYTDVERCKTIYATSSTGASTVIKLAPISGFKLFTGAGVRIKFNNGNSVDEPQLNVNGTGAKPLKKVDGTPFSDIKAGGVYTFVYDGTNYVVQSDSVQLTNAIDDSTTTAITPNAVKAALTNVSVDTASLQANIIDLAIELETSKAAELTGVNANIAIETFLTLDDVTMERGVYSSTNKWVEV